MSYSAVSHSVKSFKEKIGKDRKLKNQFGKKLIHYSRFDTITPALDLTLMQDFGIIETFTRAA